MSSALATELGETMPQNSEAERSILGAILLDESAIDRAARIVKDADFFHDHHRVMFAVMAAMRKHHEPIDLVTLTVRLQAISKLEFVGGAAYVSQLMDGVPRVTNVEHYARIVKEKSLLRGLIYATRAIQQQAFGAGDDAEMILERAREAITELELSNGSASEPARWIDAFHTFEEFENAPPLRFAINGFLQNDGATMIGGPSGHGKTLALLSIVKALLAGKGARLWDLFEVDENALRVIYLIPECSIPPFKHRLQLFGLYNCLRPNDNRFLVRTLSKGPTPRLSDPRILHAAKGAHVILDTAARFGDGDENSAG